MAAVATRNSNTIYVTGDGDIDALVSPNVLVLGVILTSGAAAEILTLKDANSGNSYPVKMILASPIGETKHLDLSESPISFPTGIRAILNETDSHVILIIKELKA